MLHSRGLSGEQRLEVGVSELPRIGRSSQEEAAPPEAVPSRKLQLKSTGLGLLPPDCLLLRSKKSSLFFRLLIIIVEGAEVLVGSSVVMGEVSSADVGMAAMEGMGVAVGKTVGREEAGTEGGDERKD